MKLWIPLGAGGAAAGLIVATAFFMLPSSAGAALSVPAPSYEPFDEGDGMAIALLAGGCFWSVQGVFQHVDGVVSAISGYAGGTADTALYNTVISGTTDHAEVVEITYDPDIISYGELMQIFFAIAHDPTQLDRQGPDVGRHYRSAIFPLSAAQEHAATAYIAQLDKAGIFPGPIVTTIENDGIFYPAEDSHQDYVVRTPLSSYVANLSIPKIEALAREFPGLYRDQPVLVRTD